jgi:lambda repressor-like predicted transcriptional regulator
MTQQERDNFRRQMEQATTAEERQKVRDAHRAMLEQRAKEKGVTLAAPGAGRGPGQGRGPGYGPRADGAYSQLFTQAERDQFRDQMRAAPTAEERQKLRDQHRALAEARAKEKGITLPQPGQGPGRGGPGAGPRDGGAYAQLFTQAERDEFRNKMHSAQTVEERMKLRDEHRAVAEARAKEKGITLPQPGTRGPRGPGSGPGWQQQQPAPQS